MYLHIGDEKVIPVDEIVGIFDMDIATVTETGKNYLRYAEKVGDLESTGENLPKSFIVCTKDNKTQVYISPISSQTLIKRVQKGIDPELNILTEV